MLRQSLIPPTLLALGPPPLGSLPVLRFETQDTLYDVSWSENHENQAVVGCGDGSVKLYDITVNDFPVQNWKEHNREVFSVSWNLVTKDTFCSSSWDGTVKVVSLVFPLPHWVARKGSELSVDDMTNSGPPTALPPS